MARRKHHSEAGSVALGPSATRDTRVCTGMSWPWSTRYAQGFELLRPKSPGESAMAAVQEARARMGSMLTKVGQRTATNIARRAERAQHGVVSPASSTGGKDRGGLSSAGTDYSHARPVNTAQTDRLRPGVSGTPTHLGGGLAHSRSADAVGIAARSGRARRTDAPDSGHAPSHMFAHTGSLEVPHSPLRTRPDSVGGGGRGTGEPPHHVRMPLRVHTTDSSGGGGGSGSDHFPGHGPGPSDGPGSGQGTPARTSWQRIETPPRRAPTHGRRAAGGGPVGRSATTLTVHTP